MKCLSCGFDTEGIGARIIVFVYGFLGIIVGALFLIIIGLSICLFTPSRDVINKPQKQILKLGDKSYSILIYEEWEH